MSDPDLSLIDCLPAQRITLHERVSQLQFDALATRLDRLEDLLERLERRLWLIVFGVVGVILAQAFQSVLSVTP
ncbi:hypothetical protein [Nereida sp. MMG025]|uniref:GTA head formation protein, RCAP_rcc01685 family n=1 Tax=Nereida sp. MMG025 TaxID=2909981 RepID=UPI001F415384|nr:hypothetical protein [Nereida sp. MMG025]MCF6443492.1 hypothetical protein [Nereida sp. MMG025]